uniref:H(+)/Cl(-) exchange transporter 4-like isoform X2 n=1 Tax=Myxine glutinosa TaxID=7769 RepID=UPI00358DDC14
MIRSMNPINHTGKLCFTLCASGQIHTQETWKRFAVENSWDEPSGAIMEHPTLTLMSELASNARAPLTGATRPDQQDDSVPGIGHYQDFETIDWVREKSRDRQRQRWLRRQRVESTWGMLLSVLDSCTGWLILTLTGMAAGALAGFIAIASDWLSDVKEGLCISAFWRNREQCCWDSNQTTFQARHACPLWRNWADFVIGQPEGPGSYILNYVVYVGVAVVFSGLAVMLVRSFAPYACSSGMPEIKTILGGFVIREYLGAWTLLVKAVTLVLAVSSGLSLGKEGPLVHVACCCGHVFASLFPKFRNNDAQQRQLFSAAVAAGVSVAFGAPMGGVLFSLEEVSSYFPPRTLWRAFYVALVAAFILRAINPFGDARLVLFYVSERGTWRLPELAAFVALGAFGGIWGVIFTRANIAWCRCRKNTRLGHYPIAEVVIVALITAAVSYPNPFMRGGSAQLVSELFTDCSPLRASPLCDYLPVDNNSTSVTTTITPAMLSSHVTPGNSISGMSASSPFTTVLAKTISPTVSPTNEHRAGPGVYNAIGQLALALVFKMATTIITFGIKVPTGLFMPSMAVGAVAGRLLGIWVEQLSVSHPRMLPFSAWCAPGADCIAPGLYAIVGAAACLGGVTRMTVSLVVIMFELTGGLEYIVPLMAAVMTSKWVADAFGREGIYEAHIRLNSYPFLSNKDPPPLPCLAGDMMQQTPDRSHSPTLVTLVQEGLTLQDVQDIVSNSRHNGFPIVVAPESALIVGFVLKRHLNLAIGATANGNAETGAANVLKLQSIVDFSPVTVTDETSMDIVVEVFCKLGIRHTLVTHNGQLLGIITKKDILRYLAHSSCHEPPSDIFS